MNGPNPDPDLAAEERLVLQGIFDWLARAPPGTMVEESFVLPYTTFSPILVNSWPYQRRLTLGIDVNAQWHYEIVLTRRPIGDRTTGNATTYWLIHSVVRTSLVDVREARVVAEA